MSIKFVEAVPQIFEYPSEASLLDDIPSPPPAPAAMGQVLPTLSGIDLEKNIFQERKNFFCTKNYFLCLETFRLRKVFSSTKNFDFFFKYEKFRFFFQVRKKSFL